MIDTHAHLDSEKYDNDREIVIENAMEKGVKKILNISSDMASIDRVIELTEKYDQIYGSVGIQPHSAYEFNEEILEKLLNLKNKKIVAIGEIGLDYHYNFSLPEIQRRVFREQARIAKKMSLPLIIHSREAFEDTINILKEEKATEVGGIIHCFTEDEKKANTYIKFGFYIGIGGAVTFKNTIFLQEAVKSIPLEKILLETDCPYMTPAPFRGKRNEPGYLNFIAEKIAELKEIDLEEVINQTDINATKIFNL